MRTRTIQIYIQLISENPDLSAILKDRASYMCIGRKMNKVKKLLFSCFRAVTDNIAFLENISLILLVVSELYVWLSYIWMLYRVQFYDRDIFY